MRLFRRGISDQSGFTIVELMITLLILGILVSIVVVTMSISRSKAQESACKANLRTIFDAVIAYRSLHDGKNPPNLDVLVDPDPEHPDEKFLKSSFSWMCPAGDLGTASGDYRTYYNSATGQTSCPRASHNL